MAKHFYHPSVDDLTIDSVLYAVANIIGVPLGTWLGQIYSWRTTFLAVTLMGVIALIVLLLFVPKEERMFKIPIGKPILNR